MLVFAQQPGGSAVQLRDSEDKRQWKFSCEDRVAKSGSSWVSFGNSDSKHVQKFNMFQVSLFFSCPFWENG